MHMCVLVDTTETILVAREIICLNGNVTFNVNEHDRLVFIGQVGSVSVFEVVKNEDKL